MGRVSCRRHCAHPGWTPGGNPTTPMCAPHYCHGDRRSCDCGRTPTRRSVRYLFHQEYGLIIRLDFASIVVLVTFLGGCMAATESNTRRDPWQQTVFEPMQENDARALRFYEDALKLKQAELVHELDSTRQRFEADKSELNRVRLSPCCCRGRAPGFAMTRQH